MEYFRWQGQALDRIFIDMCCIYNWKIMSPKSLWTQSANSLRSKHFPFYNLKEKAILLELSITHCSCCLGCLKKSRLSELILSL